MSTYQKANDQKALGDVLGKFLGKLTISHSIFYIELQPRLENVSVIEFLTELTLFQFNSFFTNSIQITKLRKLIQIS
jgi:hypothetical protein